MISIIIATYNGGALLREQLDSIAAQQYDGLWEVLVVDNRSTDGTQDFVRVYQQQLPELRLVLAHKQQGQPYAANTGAKAALGNHFIFCDADDVAAPGWLAAMAAALTRYDLVAGAIETKRLQIGTLQRPFIYDEHNWIALNFLPFAVGANLGVSRRAFETVGGFDEALPYSQDVEFSWRIQVAGYNIGFAEDAVMHYRSRQTLRDLWRQMYRYAFYYPLLYRRYARHGMPASTSTAVLERYLWLARHIRFLLRGSPKSKALWIGNAAYAAGLLKGSIDHRVLYL